MFFQEELIQNQHRNVYVLWPVATVVYTFNSIRKKLKQLYLQKVCLTELYADLSLFQ